MKILKLQKGLNESEYRQFRGAIKEMDIKKKLTLVMVLVHTEPFSMTVELGGGSTAFFYRTFSQKGSQTMKFLVKERVSTGSQGYK